MDWRTFFAQRLKQLREARGWNKKQLGNEVGLTNVSILEFEKGRKTPSVDTLVALATALDVSTDYLLGLSPPDPHVTPEGGERGNDG